jgi:antitoxin component of MazEF toxin-antitoxin module
MITARITEIDGSTVVVLSKEMLSKLGVRAGDEVEVGVAASTDPATNDRVVQQVAASRTIMEKRHDVLRRLAE